MRTTLCAPVLRMPLLLSLAVLGQTVRAQCAPYIAHAFPGVCDGQVSLECEVDSVVWSTGEVSNTLYAPAGTYSYTAYLNGAVVSANSVTIESNGWNFNGSIHGMAWGSTYAITGNASVAHCGTSIYNFPCCHPGSAGTDVYLLQDGVNTLQQPCVICTDVSCTNATFIFQEVQYGHQYVVCISDPACMGTCATDEPIVVPSCANLELGSLITSSIPGQNTGSIELIAAIPDTTEPYPIEAPVTGTISLSWLDGTPVGSTLLNAGSGLWTGLDTGWYVLSFQPDAGCQAARDTLYVPAETNTGVVRLPSIHVLSIAPTVTDAALRISSSAGSAPVRIRILDIHGRTLVTALAPPGLLSIESLPPGAYVLIASQGEATLRARFIKR